MQRYKLSFLVFVIGLFAGFFIAVGSWEGLLFVYLGEHRSPAAVRSLQDYSTIDRKALFTSVHEQMLKEASLVRQADMLAITLGHPLFKKTKGQSDFACATGGRPGLFDRIELVFIGTGITQSGDQPTMIVEAACAAGASLDQLQTVWIPMQDILNSEPKDQDLQFFGDQAVNIRLSQIPGEWPEAWALTNVRLFRQDRSEQSYTLDSALVREGRGAVMSFEWK